MSNRKFDTCFFERCAQVTLETLLGEEYADLVNEDRPDLQKLDRSLGIEVTRAMEPSKNTAQAMLKEMAGMEVKDEDRDEVDQIIRSGYGYGLQEGRYIGYLEYEYWHLAQPLRRIIESKVSKVGKEIMYGNDSLMRDITAANAANNSALERGVYNAMVAALQTGDFTIQIGNREFARILREAGAL